MAAMATNRLVSKLSGRCLCRAISWTVEAVAVGQVLVCHCSMCRRTSGASSVSFVALPKAGLLREQLLRQNAKSYRSSDMATRYFCPSCGSFVCMEYHHEKATVWMPLGALDSASEQYFVAKCDDDDLEKQKQQRQQQHHHQQQHHCVVDPSRDSHIMMQDAASFEETIDQLPRAAGFGPYRSDPCSGKPWDQLEKFDP